MNKTFYDPMQYPMLSPFNNTLSGSVPTGGSAVQMGGQFVGSIHTLSITNQAEDYGQDNYKESYIWEIRHAQECEKRADLAYAVKHLKQGIVHPNNIFRDELEYDRVWIYTCPMSEEIQHSGLNNLEMLWTEMEVGDYEICLASSKADLYMKPSTGQYFPQHSKICLL